QLERDDRRIAAREIAARVRLAGHRRHDRERDHHAARDQPDAKVFHGSGCATKKSHIASVADRSVLMCPPGKNAPPGQVWPPPVIVQNTTSAPPAQPRVAS